MSSNKQKADKPQKQNANIISEVSLVLYKTARQEIVARIRLKDHILLSFIIAVSPLFAVALHTSKYEILFLVPYLGLAVTILICRHDLIIGKLSSYCARELGNYLRKNSINPPQWDSSAAFHEMTGYVFWAKFVSYLILLELPSFAALFYNYQHRLSPFPNGTLWWFGTLAICCSLVALLISHITRWNLYRRKDWKWIDNKDET